jgi:geranylgeranyl pyrophosphate synthase
LKDTSILNQWYHSGVKETIELDIISTLHEELPQQIVAILDGQITVSKRIRSLFFNILTEGQIDHQTFLNVSLGIELAHQASLIFDDIIDDSDYRE